MLKWLLLLWSGLSGLLLCWFQFYILILQGPTIILLVCRSFHSSCFILLSVLTSNTSWFWSCHEVTYFSKLFLFASYFTWYAAFLAFLFASRHFIYVSLFPFFVKVMILSYTVIDIIISHFSQHIESHIPMVCDG